MTITIDGNGLTIERLVKVARLNEKIKLHPVSINKIKKCRLMLEEKIKSKEIMYGVNTGIGEFSEIVLDDKKLKIPGKIRTGMSTVCLIVFMVSSKLLVSIILLPTSNPSAPFFSHISAV